MDNFVDKVKDVVGKVGNTVENGIKNVSDSSHKLNEKIKLKKKINTLDSEINKAYVEIGKKYFEFNSEAPAEEYADNVRTIIDCKEKLDLLKKELSALDDKKPCPKCGELVSKDQIYCDKCGEKLGGNDFSEPEHVEATVLKDDEN